MVEACDGSQGLELFKANAEAYSLILLDLTMPVMDGAEALRHLRAIDPNTPIVLTSGYEEQEAISHLPASERRLGGFVQKPFTAPGLVALVEKVLKHKIGASRTGHAGG